MMVKHVVIEAIMSWMIGLIIISITHLLYTRCDHLVCASTCHNLISTIETEGNERYSMCCDVGSSYDNTTITTRISSSTTATTTVSNSTNMKTTSVSCGTCQSNTCYGNGLVPCTDHFSEHQHHLCEAYKYSNCIVMLANPTCDHSSTYCWGIVATNMDVYTGKLYHLRILRYIAYYTNDF